MPHMMPMYWSMMMMFSMILLMIIINFTYFLLIFPTPYQSKLKISKMSNWMWQW